MALCTSRLRREYMELQRNQLENIKAAPKETNIREWHYVISGQKDSPYSGGIYHGTVLFPSDYPYKPPTIRMMTPSGRFKPGARLCLSMSDFHPETWNPMWSVSTILLGLYSFMNDTAPTNGSVESSEEEKKLYAKASVEFNLKDKTFCEMFPDLVQALEEQLRASETSVAGGCEASAVDVVAEGVASEMSTTNDSSDSIATPASVVSDCVATAPSNQELEINLSNAVKSGGMDIIVSTKVASVALEGFPLPASPVASTPNGVTPLTTEAGDGAAASTPETAGAASPTTPVVSSMYSRMMAMKLGASPTVAATGNTSTSAVGSVNTSTKSVQSVDTLMPEPYKSPAENLNSAASPPQPPV